MPRPPRASRTGQSGSPRPKAAATGKAAVSRRPGSSDRHGLTLAACRRPAGDSPSAPMTSRAPATMANCAASRTAGAATSGFLPACSAASPTPTQHAAGNPRARCRSRSKASQEGKFKVKPEFEPQTVAFTGYPRGTIVIDTELTLPLSGRICRRPPAATRIAVGREGLQFKGTVAVGDKQEWPRWIPTLEMQKREPQKYGQYKDGMPGGGENPLGARAIYLYSGKKDTHLRIHGTNAPQSIGTNSSNGCFRMINEHVMDLYSRVRVGTQVVIHLIAVH